MDKQLPIAEFTGQIRSGIRLLLRARFLAADAKRQEWDFAVEIGELYRLGLSNCDLRWLTCKGFVVHRAETTNNGYKERTFVDRGDLVFSKESCFVLAGRGQDFAAKLQPGNQETRIDCSPDWNSESRELRVGSAIVKKFRVPAANQELILAAFEEESWTYCVDDPLPPARELNSKRRLHAAIQSLNRNQKTPLIRFRGNGQADGVCWEFLPPLEPTDGD